jgi:lipopolysaccharide transport system permease protein
MAMRQDLEGAAREWWLGTSSAQTWLTLAWYDTVLRYRKSLLGPLWITASLGVMLLGMGPLYSLVFGVPLAAYFPYVTLGIVFWRFISTTVTEGCSVITGAARYMKQGQIPLSLFTSSTRRTTCWSSCRWPSGSASRPGGRPSHSCRPSCS